MTFVSGFGGQVQQAREATIDQMGVEVTYEAAVRQVRNPDEGFLRKVATSYGPFQTYVYWAGGGGNTDRGNQGDEMTRQDRDGTWGASLKVEDGDVLWPSGLIDAQSQYEFTYPGYGRFRVERVQQMVIQGTNIGYQLGLTRVS